MQLGYHILVHTCPQVSGTRSRSSRAVEPFSSFAISRGLPGSLRPDLFTFLFKPLSLVTFSFSISSWTFWMCRLCLMSLSSCTYRLLRSLTFPNSQLCENVQTSSAKSSSFFSCGTMMSTTPPTRTL